MEYNKKFCFASFPFLTLISHYLLWKVIYSVLSCIVVGYIMGYMQHGARFIEDDQSSHTFLLPPSSGCGPAV